MRQPRIRVTATVARKYPVVHKRSRRILRANVWRPWKLKTGFVVLDLFRYSFP